MLVKICGLSNVIDAMRAVELGADALGFVMGGKVLPPEVEPHAQTVREIIQNVPESVDSFLVTHLTEAGDILDLADYTGVTGIQISEDLPLETLKQVRERTDKKIIKTVVVENETSIKKMKSIEPYCDFILLDTRFGGYTGGTGVTNDWGLCSKLIEAATKPVYIAGGLNPENLEAAMQKSYPQGVDVSTGVSHYSDAYLRKDRKSREKIQSFINTAKSFD